MVTKQLKKVHDESTWSRAKAAAMIAGMTLTEWVLQAMREKLGRNGHKV